MNKRDRTKIEKGLERLEQLLRVLKEVRDDPCKGFDWAEWYQKDKPYAKPEMIAAYGFSEHYCGTRACVAGWAGLDPWFRSRGMVTHPPMRDSNGNYRCSNIAFKRGGLESFFDLPDQDEDLDPEDYSGSWSDYLFGGGEAVDDHTADLKEAMKRVEEAITMQKGRLV